MGHLAVPVRLGGLLAAAALAVAGCSSSGGGAGTSGGSAAATVRTATGSAGTYLTDGSGRALYLWQGDHGVSSSCSGACASAWPPLLASGTPSAAGGASQAQLGTITRSDGKTQVTYAGHPLYRYAGDGGAGQTNGEGSTGFGAAWWLVAPSGSALTGTSSVPSSAPSSAPSSSGGYNY